MVWRKFCDAFPFTTLARVQAQRRSAALLQPLLYGKAEFVCYSGNGKSSLPPRSPPIPMATITAGTPAPTKIEVQPQQPPAVRIEPPRSMLEVRLGEVWAYRELLFFLVWRDLKVRYKQTAIGVAWVVLQPLLSMGVFTVFFGRLAKLPSDGLPYPVFYFAALAPWTYFSTALTTTTNVVVENQRVITKVYFPRLILPLSSVMSGLVDFGIAFVVLLALVLGYGLRPGVQAIWLPFLLLLALGTALGVGLWLSALNA